MLYFQVSLVESRQEKLLAKLSDLQGRVTKVRDQLGLRNGAGDQVRLT